ncbi:aconitase X catalytic domain-containing protein [Desulfotignum balticum]|uniref:aconitase X catalytic domain-containing protein n=1 Tax=Desulfotignum balticum TaxID=115781 RepID=UPI000420B4A7|nr:aconitase X catalytic domain-containing protein [Desulfotignum balticum]
MKLSNQEQEILEGKHGDGQKKAIELLVAVGKAFDAERLVDVSRTHVALSAQEGDTYWCELLVENGATCQVPCTTNPGWDAHVLSPRYAVTEDELALLRRTYDVYNRIGAVLTQNCTPELEFNVPAFGEVVAFSESSATPYVNSVLGARSNRESSVSALASAVVGKTPLYGLLLDENRLGTMLFNVGFVPKEAYDWGLLGYYVGMHASNRIPVLQFPELPSRPTPAQLLYFGAEAATSGSVAMFHVIGVTPEAPTQEVAFGSKSPLETIDVSIQDLFRIEERLSDPPTAINMVMVGCPHYTYNQVCQLDRLMKGHQSKVPFFVLVSDTTLSVAVKSGKKQHLEQCGVDLIAGTCVDQPCFKSFEAGTFITDSPKAGYYRKGRGQKGVIIRRMAQCVKAAITGRVK